MSSGEPSEEIQGDPRIQSHPTANKTERRTSMSVGYLTRTPQSRESPYDINSGYIYSSQPLMQQQQNMQQHREAYDRPPSGASHHASSIQSTSSNASPHAVPGQQTPRITLPPLSAITENQETQVDGSNGQPSQSVPVSPAQTPYPPQQHQQPPQPSPPYPSRPQTQYEPPQGPYSHPQRHPQSSQQVAPEQSRYQSGPNIPPPQVPIPPHQMSVGQMQSSQQMGQFAQSQGSGQYSSQSQYGYQQPPQYPPQAMYGQYPPHQMPPQMPPGIPYQPAYATSHRQRPPQFAPYPPPSGYVQSPQGAPQGWPQQDAYIAQPLTNPLNAHSPQQQYSPQLQQMQGPGGPIRGGGRRTSSGLSQTSYPPPGEPPQAPPPPQSTLKPKRKRATSGQLRVLNNVFASTFFPSTELRIALGKELNMSPRTVQIWFQNKRQSWRAQKAKLEHVNTQSGGTVTPTSSQTGQFNTTSGSYSPHPLRQEQHFSASPTHGRVPSSAEENAREEGMENDEGGGWEALRQAQQGNRDYRPNMSGNIPDHEDDMSFDDDGASPHHRHR